MNQWLSNGLTIIIIIIIEIIQIGIFCVKSCFLILKHCNFNKIKHIIICHMHNKYLNINELTCHIKGCNASQLINISLKTV